MVFDSINGAVRFNFHLCLLILTFLNIYQQNKSWMNMLIFWLKKAKWICSWVSRWLSSPSFIYYTLSQLDILKIISLSPRDVTSLWSIIPPFTHINVRPGLVVLHPLQGHHDEQDGVSNHRRLYCLLNRLFKRRLNKLSKLRVAGLREGNSRWPVNSPHWRPVTRKMSPFDDVIMPHLPLPPVHILYGWIQAQYACIRNAYSQYCKNL